MPIFIYSLKRSMRNKAAIVTQFVLPMLLIFFRPLWQNEQANGLGLLALIMMSSSVFMTQSILNDREDGVIVRILTSPITMLHYLSQNLLSAVLPLIVQTTIILAIGKGLYSWSWELTAGLLIIYTIFGFVSVAFAFAWYTVFKSKESTNSIFMIFYSIFAIIGGLVFPLELLPELIQRFSMLFPAFWVSKSFTELVGYGINQQFLFFQLILLLFAGTFLLFGGKRSLV